MKSMGRRRRIPLRRLDRILHRTVDKGRVLDRNGWKIRVATMVTWVVHNGDTGTSVSLVQRRDLLIYLHLILLWLMSGMQLRERKREVIRVDGLVRWVLVAAFPVVWWRWGRGDEELLVEFGGD